MLITRSLLPFQFWIWIFCRTLRPLANFWPSEKNIICFLGNSGVLFGRLFFEISWKHLITFRNHPPQSRFRRANFSRNYLGKLKREGRKDFEKLVCEGPLISSFRVVNCVLCMVWVLKCATINSFLVLMCTSSPWECFGESLPNLDIF